MKVEIGQFYGRLTVTGLPPKIPGKRRMIECICDCGTIKEYICTNVTRGNTSSCGCYHRDKAVEFATKHGAHGTPGWNSWNSMHRRCRDKKDPDYGGRGISVCERWNDYSSFQSDMGDRPLGTSLGRIDNDGNYEPTNCRWETPVQQSRNRRSNKIISFSGKTMLLTEWAAYLGVTRATVRHRIKKTGIPSTPKEFDSTQALRHA